MRGEPAIPGDPGVPGEPRVPGVPGIPEAPGVTGVTVDPGADATLDGQSSTDNLLPLTVSRYKK